jgi:hypothetical protein
MAHAHIFIFAVLSVVLLCSGQAMAHGFGDRLLRSFLAFAEQPLTASHAESSGWHRLSPSCDPSIGYAYTQSPYAPTSLRPVTLYYTAAGQLSGTPSCSLLMRVVVIKLRCYNEWRRRRLWHSRCRHDREEPR